MEIIIVLVLIVSFFACARWVLAFLAALWPITLPLLAVIIYALLH